MQPMIDASIIGNKIGVKLMRIKSFSFGSVDQRRTDGRHRLAPILFDKVQMVSKSVEAAPGSRDPRLHRIRYVLLADVRWHAGSQPSLTLDIQLGPKFLSLVSVDAEVRDLIGSGTLRLELDWVRPYPWLGTLYASFVKTPSIDFKLSLGGSPDVMDLAPPLRKHLKSMLDRTLVEAMVGADAANAAADAARFVASFGGSPHSPEGSSQARTSSSASWPGRSKRGVTLLKFSCSIQTAGSAKS